MAQSSGGSYFFAGDRQELAGIYTQLDKIETRQVKVISHRPRNDLLYWPLLAALVLSLMEKAVGNLRQARATVAYSPVSVRVDPLTGRSGGGRMTTMLHNFHFIRPAWLLLAPLAIGLWWLCQRRSDPLRGWRQQIAPELLEALVVGRESGKLGSARWLLVAWLVAIVAIAGPTWRLEPSPFAADATPLVILLKADVSMMQPDPAPSRLERARLKIADLGEARKGQPLGLIAYAGSAHLVLPPTRDTAIVAKMAAEIGPEIMPTPGDRLDLALREAARVLAEGKQGGSIVVLADAVDTEPAALAALRKDISPPVQFLAINSPQWSNSTVARSEDKLTTAFPTPSSFLRLRSTVATQLAQVIPVSGKVSCFVSDMLPTKTF